MTFAFAMLKAGKLPQELAYGAVIVFLLGVAYFFFNGTSKEDK